METVSPLFTPEPSGKVTCLPVGVKLVTQLSGSLPVPSSQAHLSP